MPILRFATSGVISLALLALAITGREDETTAIDAIKKLGGSVYRNPVGYVDFRNATDD